MCFISGVIFYVLVYTNVNFTDFYDVAPFILKYRYRRLEVTFSLNHQVELCPYYCTLKMGGIISSLELLNPENRCKIFDQNVNVYPNTRRHKLQN